MKIPGVQGIKDVNVRKALELIEQAFTSLENDYGLVPSLDSSKAKDRTAPPPAATLTDVTGVDGKFIISIENPADVAGPISHEIFTTSVVPVSQSQDMQRFGPGVQTAIEILDPNVFKYIGIRSKFTDSAYNRPTIWPVVVYSGLLRSSSLSQVNTAMIPIEPTILTQVGTSLTISISASTWNAGSGVVVEYPAGSITVPSYDPWYVYGLDPTKSGTLDGGYRFTQEISDLTLDDGTVSFGVIDLTPAGGAIGEGSGQGPAVIPPPTIDVVL